MGEVTSSAVGFYLLQGEFNFQTDPARVEKE